MENYKDYFLRPYLNCRKSIILGTLILKEIPIDYLLYNTYEDTRNIYNKVLVKKLKRFEYRVQTLDDVGLFGIKEIITHFDKFSEGMNYLLSLLRQKQEVYIWGATKYIPHMNQPNSEGIHSLQLIRYNHSEKNFIINDDPLYKEITYNYSIIKDTYDNAPISKLKDTDYDAPVTKNSFTYFDYSQYQIPEKAQDIFNEKYNQWILAIDDDFSFYDKVLNLVDNLESSELINNEDMNGIFDSLIEAFAIIAGSRYLCAKFLKKINGSNQSILLLFRISELAEIIKNRIIRLKIRGRSTQSITKKCLELKRLETITLQILKTGCRGDLEYSTMKILQENPLSEPENFKTTAKTSNSIILLWDEPKGEELVLAYEVYKDAVHIGTTTSLKFKVENLLSSKNYEFIVKSLGLYGELSEGVKLKVKTSRREDCDLALGKPVYASSEENEIYCKNNIVSPDPSTRWSSNYSDSEWIYIDLRKVNKIERILLNWEISYAKSFEIQISNDAVSWKKIYSTSNGNGGIEEVTGLGYEARYIKLICLERATIYGYSLWQISVFADEN